MKTAMTENKSQERKRPYKPRKSGAGRKPLKPDYDAVAILQEQMKAAVAAELNLSKASVTSYLPYRKGVYFRENCDREQISVGAERGRRMRQRKKAVEALQSSHDEQLLWQCVVAFQGYRFRTISGLPFSYKIKTGRNGELTKELWIDRREGSKSLTWSSVLLAFEKTEGKPLIERPKALGDIRGVSYIYGIFRRFGLIEVPAEKDGESLM